MWIISHPFLIILCLMVHFLLDRESRSFAKLRAFDPNGGFSAARYTQVVTPRVSAGRGSRFG